MKIPLIASELWAFIILLIARIAVNVMIRHIWTSTREQPQATQMYIFAICFISTMANSTQSLRTVSITNPGNQSVKNDQISNSKHVQTSQYSMLQDPQEPNSGTAATWISLYLLTCTQTICLFFPTGLEHWFICYTAAKFRKMQKRVVADILICQNYKIGHNF